VILTVQSVVPLFERGAGDEPELASGLEPGSMGIVLTIKI
jgi:hypothetical protein